MDQKKVIDKTKQIKPNERKLIKSNFIFLSFDEYFNPLKDNGNIQNIKNCNLMRNLPDKCKANYSFSISKNKYLLILTIFILFFHLSFSQEQTIPDSLDTINSEFLYSSFLTDIPETLIEYKITLKVNNTEDQQILSNYFDELPIKVLVNGELATFENKVISGLTVEESNITLIWNKTLRDCSYMFSNLLNIVNIDFSNFDFTNVTKMTMMFHGCQNLKNINFGDNIIENVHDMSYMFGDCYNLESLNLSKFDTKNVVNMENMFKSCRKLNFLDLSNFDTTSVATMKNMFYECHSLTSLNLNNFRTNYTNDFSYMFYECTSLTFIYISNFDFSSALIWKICFINVKIYLL